MAPKPKQTDEEKAAEKRRNVSDKANGLEVWRKSNLEWEGEGGQIPGPSP